MTETPWPGSTVSPAMYFLPCRDLAPSTLPSLSSQASFPQPHLTSHSPPGVLSSSSSFSIHITLQLSPSGPFFSLCPLKRVLIFSHLGSFTFSLPFFLPGTSLCDPTPPQPAPPLSLILFPSLSLFYPIPVPAAPQTVFLRVSPHPCLQPLLRSPYPSGVPNLLHCCPISLVLYLLVS